MNLWLWIMLASLPLAAIASAIYASLARTGPATMLLSARGPNPSLEAIADNPERHAAAVGMVRAVLVIALGVSATLWIATSGSDPTPTFADAAGGIALGAALFWLPGVLMAAAIARHAGSGVIRVWAKPIRVIASGLRPVEHVNHFVDEVIRRLSKAEPDGNGDAIAPELLSAVEEHEREGAIDNSAREMIEAVVGFGSTMVEEIMTPRTEIEALEYTDDLERVKSFVRQVGHSRIPVYEGDLDHIVGILYAKDLLHHMSDEGEQAGEGFSLRELVRPPTFVPETKSLRELLTELLAERVHVAIAADEYGGTSGLVTLEDLVEEIFGEIEDEYEQDDEQPSVDVDPESMRVEIDARKHIDDANDAMERVGLTLPTSEHYDTVGGFVVVTLGRIPDAEETVDIEGLRITIIEAEPTRVVRVRLQQATEQTQDSLRSADDPAAV